MLLNKEEFINKATLIYDKGYNKNFQYFVGLLRLTRLPLLKRNGVFMGAMQSNMLKDLAGMQQELREYQKKVSEAADEIEKKKREKSVLGIKQWIRTLQTIADGIAWRSFKFNRPLLRVMSENKDSGGLVKEGYDYVALLRRFLMMKPFIIANDLTRFLRIGDITLFFPDGRIVIQEIKGKGSKLVDAGIILEEMKKHRIVPSSQKMRQKMRQLVAQMAIINNKIEVPIMEDGKMKGKLEVDILNLQFKISNHFAKIRRLIKLANRQHAAAQLVEKGYYIEVVAGEKMTANVAEVVKKLREKDPGWINERDGSVIKLSNFDSMVDAGKDFPRNMPPYSVFPFSAHDCIRLTMGHLHIFVFVDLKVLKKRLEDQGWQVEDNAVYWSMVAEKEDTNEAEERLESSVATSRYMFDGQRDDEIFSISRTEGSLTYTSQILLTDVLVMASSFYAFDFILDAADLVYQNSQSKKEPRRTIARNYLGESDIFI